MLSEREKDRYSRQLLLENVGADGQDALARSKVVLIGCGATGTNLANLLARAGVGEIKIIDRDFIELNNLQRQVIFDEDDLERPKAVAAVDKLNKVNSDIDITGEVCDFNAGNAEQKKTWKNTT